MLYSEVKERENRFIIALKIVFPFLLLVGIFFSFFKAFHQDIGNFFLLIVLIPIYVYYIFYLIYNGFRTTLIDSTTKAFTRKKIISMIEKLRDKKNHTIVLLHVDNIADINERYGASNIDLLLKIFMKRLNDFLTKYHFHHTPIGRCGGGNFIFPIKCQQKELSHLLTIFSKELKNGGINDIEVKVDFSLIEADYDSDVKNIIEKLHIILEENKKSDFIFPNIKPDIFEQIVDEAIQNNKIFFKYQPSMEMQSGKIKIVEVLTRISTKEHGFLSKSQIERIVNYTGYEKAFDEKIFSLLLDEISPLMDKNIFFSVDISPVSLRNNSFKLYLTTLFHDKKIEPSRFILEISEKNSYEDMSRFREIIGDYQKSGFKIALNNFGGNNCSFEYIKYLPIDILKFDMEFTKKIEDPKYIQILTMYMQFARNLKIQTMLKFADKEALFTKMKAFNPDYIQGFYISKPKTIGEINEIW